MNNLTVWKPLRLALCFGSALLLLLALQTLKVAEAEQSPAALQPLTVVLQQGTFGYAGTEDTYLTSWYPNTPQHQQATLVVRSDNASASLLRFNLSPIPDYAVITAARLELYASSRGGSSPFSLSAYRVLRPWVVSEATWSEARSGVSWAVPGGNGTGIDRLETPADTVALTGIAQWYSLDVTALARDWLADPATNRGVLLKGEASQAMEYRFYSSEHWTIGQRPKLLVTYTFSGPTPTPTNTATGTPTRTATATRTATSTPTATPLPRAVHSQAVDELLSIDGELSDWPPGNRVTLDWDSANGRPPARVDPADCSVSIRSMWDQWYLYFSFAARDDVVMDDNPEAEIWHDDGIEIAIDGNNDQALNSPYDHFFSIRHDGHTVHQGYGTPQIVTRAWPYSGGYEMEVAIPWAILIPGGAPYTGLQIRINFGIHDDDDGGNYDTYLVWEGNAIWANPEQFGPLTCYGEGPWYRQTYQQWLGGYTGVRDTFISEPERTQNFGYHGWLQVGWAGNPTPPPPSKEEKAALLSFDLSSVPSDAILTRAVLYLFANRLYHSNPDMRVSSYQLRRDWTDAQATWDLARLNVPWGQAGCNDTVTDRYESPSDVRWVGDVDRWYEFDVTRIVRRWRTGEPNYGVVIKGWAVGSRGYEFISSNNLQYASLRPKLEVVWRYAPPTPTATPSRTATATATRTPTSTPTNTATPTPTFSPTPSTGEIRGIVFEDVNVNGYRDVGEPGLPGATVRLFLEGEELASRTTGSDGAYSFSALWPGLYRLSEINPPGYEATTIQMWDVHVAAGFPTTVDFGARRLETATPTSSPTPTATRTPTPTMTWSVTPSATVTKTPTSTPTWTLSPTPTISPTPTRTFTPSITPTPTETTIPICVIWDSILHEDFDSSLAGWNIDLAGGRADVSSSIIYLREKTGGEARFPLLWRNDGFPTTGDFILETRFRFSDVSPYGVTIGVGSQRYDGTRYLEGEPPVPGVEDILSIHQFDESFHIKLREQVIWQGTPGDEQWHYVHLAREGAKYILSVDGVEAGRIASNVRPVCLYLGNPTIEKFVGPWTRLSVDYVRVRQCAAWSKQLLHLPLLVKLH